MGLVKELSYWRYSSSSSALPTMKAMTQAHSASSTPITIADCAIVPTVKSAMVRPN